MSTLAYGGAALALPDALLGWPRLVGEEPPPLPNPAAALEGALRRPDGAPALATFVEPGDRVAAVIQRELPPEVAAICERVLRGILEGAGCAAIHWLRASGQSTRPGVWEDLGPRAPSERGSPRPARRSPPDLEVMGPIRGLGAVRLAGPLQRADKLILVGVGSLDPVAGFGGGAQLVARGCADPQSARSLLLHGIEAGSEAFQQAAHEILDHLPPALLVQLELQGAARPAAVFAGDPRRAFDASTAFHRRWRERPLAQGRAGGPPLMVVSAGGDPEDRDLSVALPALSAAASALGPGGALIFLAACPEGLGHLAAPPDELAASPLASALRRILRGERCVLISRGVGEAEAAALGLGWAPDLDVALELLRRGGSSLGNGAILEGSRVFPTPI